LIFLWLQAAVVQLKELVQVVKARVAQVDYDLQ
jgi:hypothetical protein